MHNNPNPSNDEIERRIKIQEWFDNLRVGDKVVDSCHRHGKVIHVIIDNKRKPGQRRYRTVIVDFGKFKTKFHGLNGSFTPSSAYTFQRLYPPETLINETCCC